MLKQVGYLEKNLDFHRNLHKYKYTCLARVTPRLYVLIGIDPIDLGLEYPHCCLELTLHVYL